MSDDPEEWKVDEVIKEDLKLTVFQISTSMDFFLFMVDKYIKCN